MQTLQSRILVFFLALLLLVLAVTLTTFHRTTYVHTRRQVEEELAQGRRILLDKLAAHQSSLRSIADTLTKDDALRQAIFSDAEDVESIVVALDNHRSRTGADVALLVELDGTVFVDTARPSAHGRPFPHRGLLDAEPTGDPIRVGAFDDAIYQLAVVPYYVPVSAPQPLLWLVLGIEIDDAFAHSLTELTGLETSFVLVGTDAGVVASSLPRGSWRELTTAISGSDGGTRSLVLEDEEYMVATASIAIAGPASLTAVLMRSAREAFVDFRQLSAQALGITLVAAVLVGLGALLIARGITRPLRGLGEAARRIAGGDYAAELPVETRGEVGNLARELGRMQQEIRGREQEIQHLAYHDDLTALPNRNRFRLDVAAAIDRAQEAAERVAVVVLDIDRFKDINDTLGHHVGDRLLQQVARRLEGVAETTGIEVARLGGDEFAALFAGTGIEEARARVEDLRKLLSEPLEAADIHLEVQASAGIALYPDHGADPASLLKQAEVAMYVAKERWLGVSFYESTEDRHSVHRLSLMNDLRRAVLEGSLDLAFQPKVSLADGAIRQVEALVRWDHPRLGRISPAEFVPIAEQTGTVRHLTTFVLERAVEQIAAWRGAGLDLVVAVNISALDLHDPTLPGRVADLLERHGVAAESLIVEVTEGSIMADPERARRVLGELEAMGLRASIDDFGTGYSSLAQLRRLPVHELKVDRSFVVEMARSEEVRLIVRSTIELGHNLGLTVVAEGVESLETMELLREMGCDLVQGFHTGGPLAAGELHQRIRAGSTGVAEPA
jgi:diguanylate cyclase (GGDEF)-like protein